MKRILAILLIFVMFFPSTAVLALDNDERDKAAQINQNMIVYLKNKNYAELLPSDQYEYCNFSINYKTNVAAMATTELIHELIDSGSVLEIEEEKYIEVLINIIAAVDSENATEIANQKKQDNLKSAKDYAMDFAEMGANAATVLTGNTQLGDLGDHISTAIDGLSVFSGNLNNWIEGLSDLEAILQNYQQHDAFLQVIENRSDGNLKSAASTLRGSMSKAMAIKLDSYANISNENFSNYSEFFFTNILFDLIKQTDEYVSDDTMRFFVDTGSGVVEKLGVLGASWELGKQIGTLVGNVVVGGENLINRVREMIALYDISTKLTLEATDCLTQFLEGYRLRRSDERLVESVYRYVDLSHYLIGCRIRGEYCMYSTVASDAGLLSWFNKKNVEEATAWYDQKSRLITQEQEQVDALLKVSGSIEDVEREDIRDSTVAENISELESEEEQSEKNVLAERDIVLVLDNSGSMGGVPLQETQKASVNFIETVLQEDANIGLVTYSDKASTASEFSVNQEKLERCVDEMRASGNTNIEDGLENAYEMLKQSSAEKKIIVLMSDGKPNKGKTEEELIAYADTIKEDGIYIYTLGFFESLGDKSSAQALLEGIANQGCHYEVEDADNLVFFFQDMADQINGTKYIYIRIACPVDVTVSYNNETLTSAQTGRTTRTSFGSLTFENQEGGSDDQTKILRLKEGAEYEVKINGTGVGTMDYMIGFMDDQGEYSDFRQFFDIPITQATAIDTIAAVSDTTQLNIDEDGDGKYDVKYQAKANQTGEIVDHSYIIYIVLACVLIAFLLVVILLLRRRWKRKHNANFFPQ